MIIGVLIISLLAFSLVNVFAKKAWQTVLSLIFGAVFIGALGLIVANVSNHFGMEKVTETTTEKIVSSADSGANLLLYKELGDGTEKIYLYKTKESQKKPTATGTDNVTNKVETTTGAAEKVTKTTYWVYKNDHYKFWFNLAGNNHEFDKRINTFKLPKDWITLSTEQAEKLAKLSKERQGSMESEAKAYVQDGLKQAMMNNPQMSQPEQEALIKKLTAAYQQEAFAKLIQEVKEK